MMNMKVPIAVIALLSTSHALSAGSDSNMNCSSLWNDDKHQRNASGAIRLTMLHHQHACSPVRRHTLDLPLSWHRSRALYRERQLEARLFFRRRRAHPLNISTPVTSAGVEYGFMAQVALGTPPTKQTVLIDTAASFSWVQCNPCGSGFYDQDGPLFDSRTSSTYSTVPCSTPLCISAGATMTRTNCSVGDKTCMYRLQYTDRSVSEGWLSRDTLIVGEETFPGFVFGCSRQYEPTFGRYSGIFGFANDRLSFFSQVVQISRQYRAFSYYLPSPRSTGYIQVGSYDESGLAFTPMFTDSQDYLLALTGIMIDGCPLDLADKKFSGQPEITEFPIYLDLGSAFSILPSHVYRRLCIAVAEGIKGYERIQSAQSCCFDPSFLSTERAVPTVQMEFRDGVRLVLDEAKLMYEKSDGRLCLGFVPSNLFLLGSMQMQMIYAVQDVEKSIMGFPKT